MSFHGKSLNEPWITNKLNIYIVSGFFCIYIFHQVSPISFRMEGTLAVRCLALKDDTGVAKVALFDKLATSTYAEGSSIEVTAVYHKTFNQRPQLTTTRESSCRAS